MPKTSTSHEFFIIDVETTGLLPSYHHRIIEIAAIRADADGRPLEEYVSLVNPNRDLGRSDIHGIFARDVKNAPQFEEVAGDILRLMAGAIFVAHNVHFDMRFVRAEFERIGCVLPSFPLLCTMQLARKADPSIPSRGLADMCMHLSITHSNVHTALGDARATADLLAKSIGMLRTNQQVTLARLSVRGRPVARRHWPELPVRAKPHSRKAYTHHPRSEPTSISRLISQLPQASSADDEFQPYLEVLDRALEDRRLTPEEREELNALAQELGMSPAQAIDATHRYLRDLIGVAFQDGAIPEGARRDLEDVQQMLGVSDEAFTKMQGEVVAARPVVGSAHNGPSTGPSDLTGKTVCFTGTFTCRIAGELASHPLAEGFATKCGMIVRPRVTMDLDFLVLADPDTMSRKGKLARKYGIRILVEPEFWEMVGRDRGAVNPPPSPIPDGRKVVQRLRDAGVCTTQPMRKIAGNAPLSGLTVVVTGTLEFSGRKETQELIKRLGGKPIGSVSARTDLLIYGDSPGSKLAKARALGVETIDEREFLRRIGSR